MTPWQGFRLWLRRAPAGERAAAAVSTAVVVTLLAWVAVPSGTSSTGGTTSATAPAAVGRVPAASGVGASAPAPVSATAVTSAGPAAARGDRGSVSGGVTTSVVTVPGGGGGGQGSGSSPVSAGHNCGPAPAGVRGVSATQMHIAVTLIQIEGAVANSAFGIPSPQVQKAQMQAQIDAINATGGIACRKVVPTYYIGNTTDENSLQQNCLDIAASDAFVDLDVGSYSQSSTKDCFAQHHIPYFGNYFFVRAEAARFYPYLFDLDMLDPLYKDTIFALHDRGFFSAANGFRKLGFIYRNCWQQLVDDEIGWIKQIGIPSSAIVTYSVGCPSALASPSDLEQAVLKFQQAGVTHVTTSNFLGDFPQFTTIAQRQGFRPKYGLADDALISISAGNDHPDYDNIANAYAITVSTDAENATPGMKPGAATQKCDAVYNARGLPSTWKEPEDAGNTCDELWMFKAAVENAPVLQASALAAGLQRAKSVPFSFPQGPNDFTGPGATSGGQFWRVTQFMPACHCWRVVDRTFHRNYP